MTSAFRFHDVKTHFPRLPETTKALAEAEWEVAATEQPPHQQPGHRPHV
jgi:hypothetical protein